MAELAIALREIPCGCIDCYFAASSEIGAQCSTKQHHEALSQQQRREGLQEARLASSIITQDISARHSRGKRSEWRPPKLPSLAEASEREIWNTGTAVHILKKVKYERCPPRDREHRFLAVETDRISSWPAYRILVAEEHDLLSEREAREAP